MKHLVVLLLFLLISLNGFADFKRLNDSLLNVMEQEMAKQDFYIRQKEETLQNLLYQRDIESDLLVKSAINNELHCEYAYYRYDSALFYLEENWTLARNLNRQDLLNDIILMEANLFVANGFYWNAAYLFQMMDKKTLSHNQLLEYFFGKVRLYYYMCSYAPDPITREKFYGLFHDNQDSVLVHIPDLEMAPFDIRYYVYADEGNMEKLSEVVEDTFRDSEPNTRLYSQACYWKYKMLRDSEPDQGDYYLLLGGISNIRGGFKSTRITYDLADRFFESGNINLAQKYIEQAQNDMLFSKASIHSMKVSELFSKINAQYIREKNADRKRLFFFSVIFSVFSVVLVILVVFLHRQSEKQRATQKILLETQEKQRLLIDKLNEANDRLAEVNHVKEEYIGVFIGLRPYYLNMMEHFRIKVAKMLKQGKVREVEELCGSGKSLGSEVEHIYREFDTMFLNIIPTFIDEFNDLLQEEARIHPKSGELTVELRIFALIRLGMTESAQISQYLRYSVNTIYNYRSRIKNKALVPRDDFEKEVMKIGLLRKF